jgi:antirestriction protein ArdC
MATEKTARFSAYELVTNRILASLEKGIIPWRKSWVDAAAPMNMVSKHMYRGINVLILMSSGYESRYWMTFNQIKALGGHVRKGETGTPVVFWKIGKYEADVEGSDETEIRSSFLLRYYTVFNVEQTSLASAAKEMQKDNPVEIPSCESVVAGYKNGPAVKHATQNRAFYSPTRDEVTMPSKKQFSSPEEYYAVLFHELTHSTGHSKRLDRKIENSFGSELYSKEELVAEIGSAFLCGVTGISKPSLDENTTAYIQNWMQVLKGDPKLVVRAAAAAQTAADLMLNRVRAEAEKAESELVAA